VRYGAISGYYRSSAKILTRLARLRASLGRRKQRSH
jgi:hypothetical protein